MNRGRYHKRITFLVYHRNCNSLAAAAGVDQQGIVFCLRVRTFRRKIVIRRPIVGDSVETGRIVGRPRDMQTGNTFTDPSYNRSYAGLCSSQ
jgi:hypothetical protein